MILKHEHLIIRAELDDPPGKHFAINEWFSDLIDSIGMVRLLGPYSVYVEKEGNKGLTCICAIETSSITMHVWDEDKPGILQLDIYSCSCIDMEVVFSKIQQFKPKMLEYVFIDRDENFVIRDKNKIVFS